jgi:hypothetical protein
MTSKHTKQKQIRRTDHPSPTNEIASATIGRYELHLDDDTRRDAIMAQFGHPRAGGVFLFYYESAALLALTQNRKRDQSRASRRVRETKHDQRRNYRKLIDHTH